MMMRTIVLLILLTPLGCQHIQIPGLETRPPAMPLPPQTSRTAYVPAEGSLWHGEESRRFLAFENRAKAVGDLLTVEIIEESTAKTKVKTQVDRESNYEMNIDSAISLQTLATRGIQGILRFLRLSDQRFDKSPTGKIKVIESDNINDFEGNGKLERKATFKTTVSCLITEVTPSGLLRLEGQRHLGINRETQIIRISGFVRPEDIRINNTVPSTLIANAEIHYGGVGIAADQQRAPWGMRVLSWILPF